MSIHVTVWNEYRHEREKEFIGAIYPKGIHGAIAEGLTAAGFDVGTATLDEPEHGLTEEVLANTDVLIWWGHKAHGEVNDAIVERVQKRVLAGMGLIVLHSGHHSKIFPQTHGHLLLPALAGGRRAGDPVGHGSQPPHRRRIGRLFRDPRGGDVRRAF